MGYIYKITCLVNQKIYIGQTVCSLSTRFSQHKRDSQHFDYPLYRAMRKYGVNQFQISLIEECPEEKLNEREIFWINQLDSVAWHNKGYNGTLGGDGCYRKEIDPKDIIKFVQQKYDVMEIANLLHCSHNVIRRVAHENNIILPNHPHQSKTVSCYQNGQLIKTFYSLRESAIWIIETQNRTSTVEGIASNIGKCANGKRAFAYGYKWIKE